MSLRKNGAPVPMTFQGFVKLNREFLMDGKTLVVLGVRDLDTGELLRSHVRVMESDPEARAVFEAFLAAHGDAALSSVEVPRELAEAKPATFPFPVNANN